MGVLLFATLNLVCLGCLLQLLFGVCFNCTCLLVTI